MEFKCYLEEQLKKHPSILPQDVAKICYQAAMGAEHLLSDTAAARRYFDAEFESVEPRDGELFECLSDDVCRVDLGVWKRTGMPSEWLFNMFVETATVKRGGKDVLEGYLSCVEDLLMDADACFSPSEWGEFLGKYRDLGMPAVHHSAEYRDSERPAYRIVDRAFLPCLPVLLAAAEIKSRDACVIAIDGRAASGKTTLANRLCRIMGIAAVRMDDFFLPPSMRTEERLKEIGGNIHYERFCDEVLPNIGKANGFSYGIFDCGIMDMSGERRIDGSRWRVVEGSYSHHPKFGHYADLRVFCSVESEEQMKRIVSRNGERMAMRFKEEWIPMEEKYFSGYSISESADIEMQAGKCYRGNTDI